MRGVVGLSPSAAWISAPWGNRYSFTGKFWCPVCGGTEVTYGPDQPRVVEVVDLPEVTHVEWEGLTAEEKRARLRQAIMDSHCYERSR